MIPARFRLSIALIVAALLISACATVARNDGPPASAPVGGAVIVARDLAFDQTRLEVPAGVTFALLFENRDGAPHNVAILDPPDDRAVFTGEIFGGPGSRTYTVPAIAAGSYKFRCDVHPEMTGTVVAAG